MTALVDKKPHTHAGFQKWITSDTIGVIILTSICAFTLQRIVTGMKSAVLTTLLKNNSTNLYYNVYNNTIAVIPQSVINNATNTPEASLQIETDVFWTSVMLILEITITFGFAYLIYKALLRFGLGEFHKNT